MRFRLIPTDDAFFGLFDRSAANVAECAHALRELLADPTVAAAHERVVACEQRGDELVQTILRRLESTFVTPFDREDIHVFIVLSRCWAWRSACCSRSRSSGCSTATGTWSGSTGASAGAS